MEELKLAGHDGIFLHARLWKSSNPQGALIIAHGLGEHGGNYQELAQHLSQAPANLDVLAYDFRGHGKSPGRRGFVPDYNLFIADLNKMLEGGALHAGGQPLFLLGHSNGGIVAAQALLRHSAFVRGLILSSPALEVAAHAPGWKVALGRLLLRLAPQVTLPVGLSTAQMTRDPAQVEALQNDPLRHDRISAPLYFGMLQNAQDAREQAASLTLPTLVILGEDDPVIDQNAIRDYFNRLGSRDRTLLTYPAMRHETFHELGRETVYSDVAAWISERLP